MTAGAAPRVRVSGPGELLATVPYLVGFTPTDSLVMIGLRSNKVEVTARLDLADVAIDIVDQTLSSMQRGGADAVIVVFYLEHDLDPFVELCVREVTAAHELPPLDLLTVRDGRFRSLDCTDAACCPPEGRSMDGTTTAEVQAVYAGVAPAASRAQLEHELDPHEPFAEDDVAMQALIFSGWSDADAVAWFAGQLADDQAKAAAEMGHLAGALLQRIAVRDAMWLVTDARTPDTRVYWRELTRRLPGRYRAPAAFLAGWGHYRRGDGARANTAVAAALTADPGYGAAALLLTALKNGVDPHAMPRLTEEDLHAESD